jgi:hypothetical protein
MSIDVPTVTLLGAYFRIASVSYFSGILGKCLLMRRKSTTNRKPPLDFGSKWQREINRFYHSGSEISLIAPVAI